MEIFLVENSPLIVQRLSEMLSVLPGVVLAGHAPAAKPAIEEILQRRPKIVLVDIDLDQGTGFDVLATLRDKAPEIDAYVLTNYDAQSLRDRAARLGAKGFYDKTRDLQTLRYLVAKRAADDREERSQ